MTDPLRLAAYGAYLAAWGVVAVAAVIGALPRRRTRQAQPVAPSWQAVVGTLLQVASALVITMSLPEGPFRPRPWEMIGTLVLAPLGALFYLWALRSQPKLTNVEALATQGAYAAVRHPIYFAFFALLIATGLLASSGYRLVIAVAVYVAGSEIRIAREEAELIERFPDSYPAHQKRTRWRYLPGLR